MLKIVTFNMRYAWDSDGINSFRYRCGAVYEKIRREMPDIIGFQEVMPTHRDWLEWMEPDYMLLGQFRNEDFLGEGSYIAVKKAIFQVLAFDTFWLSPTPYQAGSRYENQSIFPRICNIARIRNRVSGEILWVLNLHLDHISDEARVLGMQCALEHLAELNSKTYFPAIILGDLNAEPDSQVIRLCNEYNHGELKDVTDQISCTFHDFGRRSCKIDYIYMSKSLAEKVESVGVWDDVQEGIYLSDHYPVYAVLNP